MRARIRSVEPTIDPAVEIAEVIEVVEVEAERPTKARGVSGDLPAGTGKARGGTAQSGAAVRRLPVGAPGLGPNGDVVFELLERAAHLTPDECRRLDEAAAWRWWPIMPLPGAGVAGARATALVRGRAEGRADALAGLESGVRAALAGHPIATTRGSRIPACVANAALAILVRDLIDSETFETLFGPWREVMHH